MFTVLLFLKYAPTSWSLLPVILPTTIFWLVLTLIPTIPLASLPIKLIWPVFEIWVFLSVPSLVA